MGVRDPKVHWFLTYPQNGATIAELLSALSSTLSIDQYLIARELHKDGQPHLHAYLKLKDGVTLKDAPSVFSVLEKSGNYQPCRSCKNVIKYCNKGSDFEASFDIDQYLKKKGKVTSETLRTKTALEALDEGLIGINSIRSYEHARSLAVLALAVVRGLGNQSRLASHARSCQ